MPLLQSMLLGIQLWGFLFEGSFALDKLLSSPTSFQQRQLAMVPPRVEARLRNVILIKETICIRGGDIDLAGDHEDGLILNKVRNMIRSVLKFSDSKAPQLGSLVRLVCKSVESIAGISLLPPSKNPKPKKKKSSGKTKVKSKSKDSDRTESKTKSKTSEPKDKAAKALKKASTTTKKHISTEIKSSNPNFRIQKELKEFIKSPPPNLSVQVGSNIRVWIVTMVGAKNSIYEGEVFKLRISFPPQYPTVPPSVYFLQGYIPTHEHVYTNGDICLSLLGKDWRPTMTAQSIAVSILSILSSAQSKTLPMDNARHAGNKPGEYQKDWVYHDDNC